MESTYCSCKADAVELPRCGQIGSNVVLARTVSSLERKVRQRLCLVCVFHCLRGYGCKALPWPCVFDCLRGYGCKALPCVCVFRCLRG